MTRRDVVIVLLAFVVGLVGYGVGQVVLTVQRHELRLRGIEAYLLQHIQTGALPAVTPPAPVPPPEEKK